MRCGLVVVAAGGDPGQKKGRGRPPKYGKDRIDLARLRCADPGLADRAFLLYGRLVVKKYKTFLATYKPVGGVIRVVLARARLLGGVLLDRPGSERGIDPRDGGRPLGVGAGLPRRQGGSWSGTEQLRHVWANVGAWNLIGWWHTLVELWAWDRPQSRLARPERLAVGQARASSVACQSLSGVTSRGVTGRIFVATVSRARAEKSAGSLPHAPSRMRLTVLESADDTLVEELWTIFHSCGRAHHRMIISLIIEHLKFISGDDLGGVPGLLNKGR